MQFGDRVAMRNGQPMPCPWAILQAGNLYAFVMNNPVRWVDPSGRIAIPSKLAPFFQRALDVLTISMGVGTLLSPAPVAPSGPLTPTTVVGPITAPSTAASGTQTDITAGVADATFEQLHRADGNTNSKAVADGIAIVYSQNLTPYERRNKEKSIKNLKKRMQEHQEKLELYKRNPDAHDNQGHLRNAPNQQIREQIIRTRIEGLEREIRQFQRLIDINQQLLQ